MPTPRRRRGEAGSPVDAHRGASGEVRAPRGVGPSTPAPRRAGTWKRGRRPALGRRQGSPDRESGNAIVEFVFLGVILLLPLVYVLLAVFYVQRNVYGVTQAAREVGRAYATTGEPGAARYAARLAMQDQNAPDDDLQIGWTGPQGDCDHAQDGLPPLARGEVFAVCVTRAITIPGVPSFIGARHNTVTGRFVVHVDEYRDFG